ncbi:topoisomerase, partial [Klebsiella pneumoniae]|nr:topoisomerase [Klebsiella pneumoniae]EKZ6760151.1 topoisomerase [Klebsiella pneumoniae]ELA1229393.1 topoisomerase [Klebsiella pneumoniae]HBR6279950.1 topoisomerase [Klebsiella pneumoniae]HBR8856894.1 topoisomerase [Klebsiella pneumoniae]
MSHSTNYNSPAKTPMQYAQETFDLVKSHVQQLGGWRNVLTYYPEFQEALEKAPRSVKCPFTGSGKTKFRFKDRTLESVHAIHEDYPHNTFIDGIDLIAELK